MFCHIPESKSTKKNRKRRSGGKKESGEANVGFSIEEDFGLPTSVEVTSSVPSPPIVDPLTDLKRQLTEAKAAKVDIVHCHDTCTMTLYCLE